MKHNLPVILLKGTIMLPETEIKLEYNDEQSKSIVDTAEFFHNNDILVVSRIESGDVYDSDTLPKIAVISKIIKRLILPNGAERIVIKGISRVSVLEYINPRQSNLESLISTLEEKIINDNIKNSLIKKLYNEVEDYTKCVPSVSNELLSQIDNIDNLSKMTDMVVGIIPLDKNRLFEYLIEVDPTIRVEMLLEDMYKSKQISDLENILDDKVQKSLDDEQKKYVLKEKVKIIKKELGDISLKEEDVKNLRLQVEQLDAPKSIKKRILNEILRYESMSDTSQEISMVKNYIDWMLKLPWNKKTKEYNNINTIKNRLNKSHYGLEEVKLRIIEYLAVKKNSNNLNSPIICLVGPPGVGKTTLAYSIAKCINRNFVKISVGGVGEESIIKGHTRTYVGSLPGKIIDGLSRAKSSNPVFLIDEIDKMTKNFKCDPESALLEVLDSNQNKYFKDNYIDENVDLSDVLFITTANDISNLSSALKDRLEIINITGYTELEKLSIAKQYLIPNICKNHGLERLKISDSAILDIIRFYTHESGLRELERLLSKIVRKIVTQKVINNKGVKSVNEVSKYLGKKIYDINNNIIEEVGISNSLFCTVTGGDMIQIESTYYQGKGELIVTGSLGDEIKESAKIALSYIKANYKLFGIDYSIFKNDIHINIPNISMHKDGPSAGVSIVTSLISSLSNKCIKSDIAYTGEITLRGNILKVGGIKEKAIGAYLNGIKTVFIPYSNIIDLEEVPQEIKDIVKFIPVKKYEDVFSYLKNK